MHVAPVYLYPKLKGENHMSREIRKVPANWQHPLNERGGFIALDIMPEWTAEEATHFMMYETCSEGTPISPAFSTIEELAHYLADNGISAFGSQTADYDHWLKICKGQVVPVSLGGGIFAI
jgi:putative sterol carrier protein